MRRTSTLSRVSTLCSRITVDYIFQLLQEDLNCEALIYNGATLPTRPKKVGDWI